MTRSRKQYGRRTEPVVVICSVLILLFSGAGLAWLGRETIRHVTADTQPATVVSVDSHPNPFQKRNQRRERSVSFELDDGTVHASSVRKRLLWHPSPGDRILVYAHSPDAWTIHEEFSWTGTLLWTLALLVPWLFLILKVAEKLNAKPANTRAPNESRGKSRRRS